MPMMIEPISAPASLDLSINKQALSPANRDYLLEEIGPHATKKQTKAGLEQDPLANGSLITNIDLPTASTAIPMPGSSSITSEAPFTTAAPVITNGDRVTDEDCSASEYPVPVPSGSFTTSGSRSEAPRMTGHALSADGDCPALENHSLVSNGAPVTSNASTINLATPVLSGVSEADADSADAEKHLLVTKDAHAAVDDVLLTEQRGNEPGLTGITSDLPALLDTEALTTASKILRIIHRYSIKRSPRAASRADEGTLKYLAVIYGHIRARQAVPMCLPAFPFKSPNASLKVLGKLPDRAEELALAHLNGMCSAIADIYPPGAKLTIISDGLVYNDLLGVPDKDVWAYGETLRAMAVEKGFTNIEFCRLRDLVSLNVPETLDEMLYVTNASGFRRALLNTFSNPDWEWKVMSKLEDVCMTYRGYIKFLETDLQDVYPLTGGRTKSKYKRGIEYIAKEMMARGDAFANAVRQNFKDHVRLSIHPSNGASKLSISALPVDTMYTTPWHCTVAVKLDGTVLSGMRSEFVSDDTMELVYENGRPSYFREKSDLFAWGEEKGGIVSEPLYPSGWLIKPSKGPGAMNIKDIEAVKVRALAENNSPVVLRDFFGKPNEDAFVEKSKEFGEPLPWKFGLLLKVKDHGADTQGLNNVLSAEWMPFHFDGLFKTVNQVQENGEERLVSTPPRFQFFAGATSSPRHTGFTLFCTSTQFFKHLPPNCGIERLAGKTWSVSTSSFNQTVLKGIPLVELHPTTGKPCLRYHEPWPQSKTKFDATEVTIEGCIKAESTAICGAIDSALHDRRVAYYHVWEKGDLLVSDNILAMHTRSDFQAGSDRELWRIHFD